MNPKNTLWKTLCPGGGEYIEVGGKSRHICGYLKDFLFDPKNAQDYVSILSGGQKNRLLLAKVLANPGNFLILDEPTNDLDMDTLDILEEIVANYQGTLFVASHDRDFLDQTVTQILSFEGNGKIEKHIGGYTDYLKIAKKKTTQNNQTKNQKSYEKTYVTHNDVSKKSKALSYKFKYELDNLPATIDKLEKTITQFNQKISDPDLYSTNPKEFNKITSQLENAVKELKNAEQRWLQLEEMK